MVGRDDRDLARPESFEELGYERGDARAGRYFGNDHAEARAKRSDELGRYGGSPGIGTEEEKGGASTGAPIAHHSVAGADLGPGLGGRDRGSRCVCHGPEIGRGLLRSAYGAFRTAGSRAVSAETRGRPTAIRSR